MSKEEVIKYWLRAAERDRKAALDNFKTGHYNWSLFMWQLVVERAIKALIVKNNQEILPIHKLTQLIKRTNLTIDDDMLENLKEISAFNLDARYEDYKEEFYKKATKKYAQEWGRKAERIFRWLVKQA